MKSIHSLKTIFQKEYEGFVSSAVAQVFLGTFLLLVLFSFFWVEKFFERNICDLRPLFHWMPVFLIFLVAALTMRSWAEERSQGTLELLLTWPLRLSHVVWGKFLGVLGLVALALALTTPLVVTASLLGQLDFGPVVAGYFGSLLVACTYISIGLWVSAQAGSQIVALIGTVLVCGFFFVLGSDPLVTIAGPQFGEVLRELGTGSRFESISRGVIDLRDVAYYLSLALFFGTLNVYALTRERFDAKSCSPRHRALHLTFALLAANLLVLNLWLAPLTTARLDLTARKEFTVSEATRNLLRNLQEPLTITFYSNATHPLLDPLRPQVRDLIREYEILSHGRVKGRVVDPTQNPQDEREAGQLYGIKPVPFQVPGRNEVKIVNSYFNILIQYGDQHLVLGFEDLIELNVSNLNQVEVKLRNLEYDLTRGIKKVVTGFRGPEELFAALDQPVKATLVLTPHTIPGELADVPVNLRKVMEDFAKRSDGKFTFTEVDPDQVGATYTRATLEKDLGIKPFAVSALARDTFFLHTLLAFGSDKPEVLYPTGDLEEASLRADLEQALKRHARGFSRTVGLWTPPSEHSAMSFGQPAENSEAYRLLQETLSADYTVKPADLSSGHLEKGVDLLILVKPQRFTDVERFAVDQFLMRGGTVVVAGGHFSMAQDMEGGLRVETLEGGLEEWLKHFGVTVEPNLVMDEQNEAFPVPVTRDVQGFQIRDLQLINYPFFVDIRSSGMADGHPALAGLPALTLQWSSSVQVSDDLVKTGAAQVLLRSSGKSWTKSDTDIQPNFERFPETGFAPGDDLKSYVLSVVRSGPMSSYFVDKPSPLLQTGKSTPVAGSEASRLIPKASDSARLVVIGSGDFVSDQVLGLSRSTGQDRYINNLNFLLNLVDWSLQDVDLLSIRSRGTFARTLFPLPVVLKNVTEATNYGVVLALLLGFGISTRLRRKRVRSILEGKGNHPPIAMTGKEKVA